MSLLSKMARMSLVIVPADTKVSAIPSSNRFLPTLLA
jgi:hypothetical protein